jgi:hypothetical protein
MKIHGMLFVAAGLLFLLYHESQTDSAPDSERSGVGFLLVPGAILVIAVIALLAIGTSRGAWIDLYQFTLPGCAMVAIVAWTVLRRGRTSRAAKRSIIRAAVPYLLGAATPVAAFVAYYAAAGALPDLVRDVVLLPTRALDGASLPPPLPLGLVPLAIAAFVAMRLEGRAARLATVQYALAIVVSVLMLVPKTGLMLELIVWSSLAEATPVVIPLLAILAVRSDMRQGDGTARSRSVLLGCVAAFCSLVQFPFAAPIYFSYSFPLLLLAVVAVLRELKGVRIRALQGLTCVYLLFGALYISPMKLPGLRGPVAHDDVALLDLPRGGLRVGRGDAENYPIAVQLLRTHASSGVIYAGPDAPEVYFLSELRNPTPAIFDYLVPDTLFHEHLLQRLDTLGVNAVALRRRVVHSPPLEPQVLDSLVSKFPFAREVGRFTIRWR